MRAAWLAPLLFIVCLGQASADDRWGAVSDALRAVAKAAPKIDTPGGAQRQAGEAVEELLGIAVSEAGARLERPGGFYDEPAFRIRLPGRLGDAQTALAPLGMSGPLDKLERSVNDAATAATPEMKARLLAAVRSMTIPDAIALVRGGDGAATAFLRAQTQEALASHIQEPLEGALEAAGAFKLLEPAAALTGSAPSTDRLREDMINYAVRKTLDGMYGAVAESESAIRRDPARYGSAALRAVFSLGQ